MTIAFDCPECMSPLQLADSLAGQKGKCPACGTVFHVPRGQPAAKPPTPAPAVPPPRPARTPATRPTVPVARPAPGTPAPPASQRPAAPPRPTPAPATRPTPRGPAAPELPPDEDFSLPAGRGGGVLLPVLPVLFLLVGLSTVVARDFLVKGEPPPPGEGTPEDNRVLLDPNPRLLLQFHDQPIPVDIGSGGVKPAGGEATVTGKAIWEPSMRFGLQTLGGRDGGKKLTFEPMGGTNNTVVRLDGREYIFGEQPFRREDGNRDTGRRWPGRWETMKDTNLGSDATGRRREGARSVWVYDSQQVYVTQTVEIVPGQQSRLLDTCLVRYRLENKDTQAHAVGLRFLLDTYIGGNDGVPFTIPGQKELCNTLHDFQRPADVPDFIQALEYGNLQKPGTICHLQLRLGGKLDPPDRVTLGAWPNPELRNRDPRCLQEKTLWTVPLFSMRTLDPPDSAVTVYWDERELAPGGSREVGFTYGLGAVASGEGLGKLALTVGGSFAPGGEFTLTAYVSNPKPGQTLTLTLPAGFRPIDGELTKEVPPLPPGAASPNSPVSWRIRAGGEGQFTLKVQSSTGVSQTQNVRIKGSRLFD